jgi:hypothetical protein
MASKGRQRKTAGRKAAGRTDRAASALAAAWAQGRTMLDQAERDLARGLRVLRRRWDDESTRVGGRLEARLRTVRARLRREGQALERSVGTTLRRARRALDLPSGREVRQLRRRVEALSLSLRRPRARRAA